MGPYRCVPEGQSRLAVKQTVAFGPDGGVGRLRDQLIDPSHEPRPLVLGPEKLVVIWSAKSASTTVLLWYFWHCGLLEAARLFGHWPHLFRNRVLYAADYYRAWVGEVDITWRWLRVVRDPCKRAVSSYRHALQHGYEDGKMTRVMRRRVAASEGFSFEFFLDYLSRIDIAACNLHHRQQVHPIEKLVTPSEVINVDKSDLMEQLRAIDATLGKPEESVEVLHEAIAGISDIHHARHILDDTDHAGTQFRAAQAQTSESWPGYGCFLGKSTCAKIARIYAADFACYADYL